MALRAFHANPQVGGFGGESSGILRATSASLLRHQSVASTTGKGKQHKQDTAGSTADAVDDHTSGDAFCQIVKELVDNAVDACATLQRTTTTTATAKQSDMKRSSSKRGHSVGNGKANGILVCSKNGSARDDQSQPGHTYQSNLRVRVEIQPYTSNNHNHDNDDNDDNDDSDRNDDCDDSILQVTVSDNGCGMADTQRCVNAFHTSKAATATAGRYGIGLTLCLVHAQRLVPKSFACITSARAASKSLTRAFFIVNTAKDKVLCHKKEKLVKSNPKESGTCVSLLVPGGAGARSAWPRLAAYFARFQWIGPDLPCRLEVLAPTLSSVPIYIRTLSPHTLTAQSDKHLNVDNGQPNVTKTTRTAVETPHNNSSDDSDDDIGNGNGKDEHKATHWTNWEDTFRECSNDDNDDWNNPNIRNDQFPHQQHHQHHSPSEQQSTSLPSCNRRQKQISPHDAHKERRTHILQAASVHLQQPLQVGIENVAHSKQVIRLSQRSAQSTQKLAVNKRSATANSSDAAQLHVDMIVCGASEQSTIDEEPNEHGDLSLRGTSIQEFLQDHHSPTHDVNATNMDEMESSATMEVIRFVNGIPLMDGAEAVACGLMHGIRSKTVWGSFGLKAIPTSHGDDRDSSGSRGTSSHPLNHPLNLSEHAKQNSVATTSTQTRTQEQVQTSVAAAAAAATSRISNSHQIKHNFEIHDSDQVLPFLADANSIHRSDPRTRTNVTLGSGPLKHSNQHKSGHQRKRKVAHSHSMYTTNMEGSDDHIFMPAKVRLGRIIVLIHLHAKPSLLPLPTLSKGRLPLNHPPIQAALHNGLRECLKCIQTTNPNLLLTAHQLRSAERESRYVPAVSWALSRMIMNSSNQHMKSSALSTVRGWDPTMNIDTRQTNQRAHNDYPESDERTKEVNTITPDTLASIIKERLLVTLQAADDDRKKSVVNGRKKSKHVDDGEHQHQKDYDEMMEDLNADDASGNNHDDRVGRDDEGLRLTKMDDHDGYASGGEHGNTNCNDASEHSDLDEFV